MGGILRIYRERFPIPPARRRYDMVGPVHFATILEFEGMARILTILARGYLFHGKDGAVISGDPHDRVDHARRALCAWCSVPEDGKRVQGKEWQFQTDFSELHTGSRSWWTRMGPAGSSAMFSVRRTSC